MARMSQIPSMMWRTTGLWRDPDVVLLHEFPRVFSRTPLPFYFRSPHIVLQPGSWPGKYV